MSQSTSHKCDRCGKLAEEFPAAWLFLRRMFGGGGWDLCEKCSKELYKFMKREPTHD